MSAWETSIDARFLARLLRRRGLIDLYLARRITAAVERMTNRLPLLARLRREVRPLDGLQVPIVHARWLPAAADTPPGRAAHDRGRSVIVVVPRIENVTRQMTIAPPVVAPIVTPRVVERVTMVAHTENPPAIVVAPRVATSSDRVAPSSIETRSSSPNSDRIARERNVSSSIDVRTVESSPRPLATPSRVRVGSPLSSAPKSPRETSARADQVAARRTELSRPSRVAASQNAPLVTHLAPRTTPAFAVGAPERSSRVDGDSTPVGSSAVRVPITLPHLTEPPARDASPAKPPVEAPVSRAPDPVPAAAPRRVETPSPPQLDLVELAERVQRILERQSVHERARKGQR